MTAITNGQAEIDTNGLVIGDGTNFPFTPEFIGWWAASEVRRSDSARSNRDGYLLGRDLGGKHATTLVVYLLADSETELGDRIDDWKHACRIRADSVVAVRANVLGRTRVRFGRFRIPGEVRADTWAVGDVTGAGCDRLYAKASAQFESLDGLTYGDDLHSLMTERELPGSGFTVPFDVPFSLGASTGGSLTVTNAGNTPVAWTGRLDGPLTYPEISHVETGRRLFMDFAANGGVDLATGDWIDLDSTTRSVLLNGSADRSTQLTIDSTWWDLDPGDNTFSLAADDGVGTLTVYWRDGYHS